MITSPSPLVKLRETRTTPHRRTKQQLIHHSWNTILPEGAEVWVIEIETWSSDDFDDNNSKRKGRHEFKCLWTIGYRFILTTALMLGSNHSKPHSRDGRLFRVHCSHSTVLSCHAQLKITTTWTIARYCVAETRFRRGVYWWELEHRKSEMAVHDCFPSLRQNCNTHRFIPAK